MEQIPHSRPWITEADGVAVLSLLASSMLAQGSRARRLEQQLADWLHAGGAVAVGSGSAAIVLALHGLGVSAGDEVVLPTYVCRSVLEAVLTSGAQPVLCDVGPTWVMTADNVLPVISARTRAIVVPHLYGIFADIDEFRRFGVPIIEDCAQALDASRIRPIKGDVAVLSFHPTKCLTAGEGGMVLAVDIELGARMRAYRDGGAGIAARLFSPLSDLAASLVMSQLDRYEQGLARRREIADHYRDAVKSCCPGALIPLALENTMFFRFPLRLAGGIDACQGDFAAMGVQVRRGVDELLHRTSGRRDTDFPSAVRHFESTVSLPIYPALARSDELRCIHAITTLLPQYGESEPTQ